MKSFIKINNLKKSYNDFKLNIDNLELKQGEFVGLIGENGSGKSTLIKLILNIVSDYEGTIELFNKKKYKNDITVKKDLSVVFDSKSFSDYLCIKDINTILKNIYKSTWDENYFFTKCDNLGISNYKKIGTFSRGMQANLELITSLSHSPKLLILDEATSNLDPVARKDFNLILRDYVNNDNTVLFSSHIVNELEKNVDRIILLDKGKIVLDENIDIIKNKYRIVKTDSYINFYTRYPNFRPLSVLETNDKLTILACNLNENIDEDDSLSENGLEIENLIYMLKKGKRYEGTDL
ncbi:ABC transporter ATP-binding protein [Anaerococcus porci]|uniref:ABC transporter ATP-binding protein n=1 Tax=Anaerococcus porci TaxID=2652269 RepID=UPI002A757991|nr:ABC transporter ATP-binding protein [Anaerococcus porci]MDY3006532.1 ABC transporter ATP-binding protein [Anaerococcus porci]